MTSLKKKNRNTTSFSGVDRDSIKEKDDGLKSLLNLIDTCCQTSEGKKQVSNWIKHKQNPNIGKRTGKLVPFTTDLDKLFPSSPASSSDDDDNEPSVILALNKDKTPLSQKRRSTTPGSALRSGTDETAPLPLSATRTRSSLRNKTAPPSPPPSVRNTTLDGANDSSRHALKNWLNSDNSEDRLQEDSATKRIILRNPAAIASSSVDDDDNEPSVILALNKEKTPSSPKRRSTIPGSALRSGTDETAPLPSSATRTRNSFKKKTAPPPPPSVRNTTLDGANDSSRHALNNWLNSDDSDEFIAVKDITRRQIAFDDSPLPQKTPQKPQNGKRAVNFRKCADAKHENKQRRRRNDASQAEKEDSDFEDITIASGSSRSDDNADGYGEPYPAYIADTVSAEETNLKSRSAKKTTNNVKITKKSSKKTEKIPPVRKALKKANNPKQKETTVKRSQKRATQKAELKTSETTKRRRHMTYLESQCLSPPKLIVPEPSPDAIKRGLRRSTRTRIRPLQRGFGEELVYGDDGELLGVKTATEFYPLNAATSDRRTAQHAPSLPKKNKRKRKKEREEAATSTAYENTTPCKPTEELLVTLNTTAATERGDTVMPLVNEGEMESGSYCPQEASGLNCTTAEEINNTTMAILEDGEIVSVRTNRLICIPENETFFGDDGKKWESDDTVRYTKGISTKTVSLGTVMIEPGQEKSFSCPRTASMSFVVMSGIVEIGMAPFSENAPMKLSRAVLRKGSYFHVPIANGYRIKNASECEQASLFFAQNKADKKMVAKP